MSGADRIARTPGVCGGRACIEGHRIRVLDILEWHEHRGATPDEIVTHFPSITLADVHAALSYYFDHVEEIQSEMQAERELAESARGGNASRLDARLKHAGMKEAS